jgi:hypothetical protein
MTTNYTLRAAFTSCSNVFYTLTDATKLFSVQSSNVRVATYVGYSAKHAAWLMVTQTRVGEGRTARYAYQHAISMNDMNNPVFKKMNLRAAWKKRSLLVRSFCGLRMITARLDNGGEARVYALKDSRNHLVVTIRIGSGVTAKYSHTSVGIPESAFHAFARLTSFFTAR